MVRNRNAENLIKGNIAENLQIQGGNCLCSQLMGCQRKFNFIYTYRRQFLIFRAQTLLLLEGMVGNQASSLSTITAHSNLISDLRK